MPDIFTQTSHTGLFGNLGKSIKSALVGIVLFIASFPLLWMNEGCINMGKVAQTSIAVSPSRPDPANDAKLVAVTESLATAERLGDPKYVKEGSYVSLSRDVECYEWVEEKETRTEKRVGGGSDTKTTYRYDLKWTGSHHDSSSFQYPQGHQNPPARETEQSWCVKEANVGAYAFAPADTTGFMGFRPGLPAGERLNLTPDVLSITPATDGSDPSRPRLAGNYLFLGAGSLDNPALGDARISFHALVPGGRVTIFGQQTGNRIVAFPADDSHELFRVLPGTREEAISTMLREHALMTWILRVVGFLMMWGGMCMVLGPLTAVMDVLPFLGNAGRTVISFVLFPVALVFTGVTIVVSMIAHSIVALGVVMAGIVVGGIVMLKSRKPRTA